MARSFDFSEMDTATLTRTTLQHTKKLGQVQDNLWEATIPAFLGSAPFAMALAWYLVTVIRPGEGTWFDPLAIALVIISGALAYGASSPWRKAGREIKAFSAECKARTAELKRRRGEDA